MSGLRYIERAWDGPMANNRTTPIRYAMWDTLRFAIKQSTGESRKALRAALRKDQSFIKYLENQRMRNTIKMKPFEITLTNPQHKLFRNALTSSCARGDCSITLRTNAYRIKFTDYEGVNATLNRLADVRTSTEAELRSAESLKIKVATGLLKAMK